MHARDDDDDADDEGGVCTFDFVALFLRCEIDCVFDPVSDRIVRR
jgi:hypothetical protein